ncbi:hypothetical protein C8R46DRAFT_1137304 [Mycena filopes]|nr:hypothetical protein C8R46DRAFT_1137304 [Mycena filopes]
MNASPGTAILYPRLPRDMERTIFEIVARSRQKSIPKLMLVAWTEPLLYEITVINPDPFYHELPVCPPGTIASKTSFIQNSVRHLFFSAYGDDASELGSILTACGGIINILTKAELGKHLAALCALSSLRRLTAHVESLFEGHSPDEVIPLFRHMTHLEFLGDIHDGPHSVVAHLELMPVLTHVAFNGSPTLDLESVLLPNSRLQCIVFISSDPPEFEKGSVIAQDPRFVAMTQHEDYRVDWVRGADTGCDYWTVVEAFIDARRAGKVDRSTYHIDDTDRSWV